MFGLVVEAPEWFRDKIVFFSLIVFFASFYLGPRQITKIGFYEGTAQIVPVLFIALAVEVRFFRFRDMDETDRRSAGITALALILAGYQSLKVLANGDPRVGDAQLTVGALVAATTALALSAIVGQPTHEVPRDSVTSAAPAAPSDPSPQRLGAWDVVGLVILAALGKVPGLRRRHLR